MCLCVCLMKFLDFSETLAIIPKFSRQPTGFPKLSRGFCQAYVLADTSLAGYRRYQQEASREEIAAAACHTAVFQTVASLALPADAWAEKSVDRWQFLSIQNGDWYVTHIRHNTWYDSVRKSFLFGCQGVGLLACLRMLIWHY